MRLNTLLVLGAILGQSLCFWSHLFEKYSTDACPSASGPKCALGEFRTLISTAPKSAFEIRFIWLPFTMLSSLQAGDKCLQWDSLVINRVIEIQYWLSLLGVLYDECCAGVKRCELDRRIFLRHRFLFRERTSLLLDCLEARVRVEGDSSFFVTLKDSIVYNVENVELRINQINGILRGKAIPSFEEGDFSVNSINRLIKRLIDWNWKPSTVDWQPSDLAVGFSNELNAYEFLFRWEWLCEKLKIEGLYVEFDEYGRLDCDYCSASCQVFINSGMRRSDSSSFVPRITNLFGRMKAFVGRSISSIPSHSTQMLAEPSKNLYWSSLGCPARHNLHLSCVNRSCSLRCEMCKPADYRPLNDRVCVFFSQFQHYIENSLFRLRFDKESLIRTFCKVPQIVDLMGKMQKWNRELSRQLERCSFIFQTLEMNTLSNNNNAAQAILQQLFMHRINLTAGQESFFTLRNVAEQARIKMIEIFSCSKASPFYSTLFDSNETITSATASILPSSPTIRNHNFTPQAMEEWIPLLNKFWIDLRSTHLKQSLFDAFVEVICYLPSLAEHPYNEIVQGAIVKNIVLFAFWFTVRACQYNRLHILQCAREDWVFKAHFCKATSMFSALGEFYLAIATCGRGDRKAIEVRQAWTYVSEERTSNWLKAFLAQSPSQELQRFVSKIDLKDPSPQALQELVAYFWQF